MRINVIVFDFDGTLVESNAIKYQAFFELFPKDETHEQAVRKVLETYLEETRYVILEQILCELGTRPENVTEYVNILAEQYNELVVNGAKTCPECHGAEGVLRQLSQTHPLYLSSTTPEVALREIVEFRKWSGYFHDIAGYPRKKYDTLQAIVQREQVVSQQVLVVGDGESDRISARDTGCRFFDVKEHSLSDVLSLIG